MIHRGTQYGLILAFIQALIVLSLPFSNAYPHRPFHSRNLILANDSFVQSYTNNGSILITAKPVKHPKVDPYLEDNLRFIIACPLVLLLVALLGLFIRHHGLTLPSTNSHIQRTPRTDTEEKKGGVSGLGFSHLESVAVPPAAHVK